MEENAVRVVTCSSENAGISNGDHSEDIAENDKISSRLLETAAQKYMHELMIERSRMENHFPLAIKLIDEALERIQLNGRIPTRDQYADVYQQRTIKLSQKVHVPIKDRRFNYVGKLLGPKGNSLRRLQEETQCKIVILGRFSMKDRAREEELRNSADAKYAHLNLPLHVEVSTIAPPAEAYARVAYALAEIRRYLIPDKHDDIRQEQYRELMEDPEAAKKLTLRQIQQHNIGANSHNIVGSGNNVGSGNYRPKHHQYSHNDDTCYYRSQNSFYQPKHYISAAQRGNAIHASMAPQGIVRASIVNAANFNGRGQNFPNSGGTMMSNNVVASAGGNIGGATAANIRYRQSGPFQFVKK